MSKSWLKTSLAGALRLIGWEERMGDSPAKNVLYHPSLLHTASGSESAEIRYQLETDPDGALPHKARVGPVRMEWNELAILGNRTGTDEGIPGEPVLGPQDWYIWNYFQIEQQDCDRLIALSVPVGSTAAVLYLSRISSGWEASLRYYPNRFGSDEHYKRANLQFWEQASFKIAPLKLRANMGDRLIYGNRYDLEERDRKGLRFRRQHVLLEDPMRDLYGTLPLLKRPLFDSTDKVKRLAEKEPFATCVKGLYEHLQREAEWVVARGAAMEQNLEALSAVLASKEPKVVFVSGPPGCGKEALASSVYYCRHPVAPVDKKERFHVIPARQLEPTRTTGAHARLKDRLLAEYPGGGLPSEVVVFIDELNKVDCSVAEGFRSDLLRVLEDSKGELGVKVLFILAASDHLETLALGPPQDFWTRISHYLRVAHPLGFTSEETAVKFLSGLVALLWAKEVVGMLGGDQESGVPLTKQNEAHETMAHYLMGKIREGSGDSVPRFEASRLAQLVVAEVVDSLAPMAVHDELSVRGVRSVVGQVFARVVSSSVLADETITVPSWLERKDTRDGLEANEIRAARREARVRRMVQRAIQEVLAVLNAARHTPRTSGDTVG